MNGNKKSGVKRVYLDAERFKGGVGDEGLATAPRRVPDQVTVHAHRTKPGLGPVLATASSSKDLSAQSLRVPISELRITLLKGDSGHLYYLVAARDNYRILPAEDVTASHSKVMSVLSGIGILATDKAEKAAVWEKIHNPVEDPESVVATRRGFEQRPIPRYFHYGNGDVITCAPSLRVYSLTNNPGGFDRIGKLRVYEKAVSSVLRNQAIPLTVFFVGLSEALKPFLAAAGYNDENMMVDLVGRSTSYKTALTSGVAGSIWGRPHRQNGYARRWSMTEQKIEDYFRDFNNHLLILDEATLAHRDLKRRGEVISDVVFRMSSGMGRARTGESAASHSLTVLSSSNDPMKTILASSPEGQEALGVRLISFSMPERDTRFFDTVPDGFKSVAEAMTEVIAVIQSNHGLLARRFIRNILQRVNGDYPAFLNLLKEAMEEFLKAGGFGACDAGEIEYRRAQPLALAYATAVIAFDTGTLRGNRWGNVRKTVLRAWFRYGCTQVIKQGDPRFNEYMEDPANVFVDLRDGGKPELSDDALAGIAGFIRYRKDRTLSIAVTKTAVKGRLGYSPALLKQLQRQGVLLAKKEQRMKLALRLVHGREKRDAFYVFALRGVPDRIKFWDGEQSGV